MPPKTPSKASSSSSNDVRDDGTFEKVYRRVKIMAPMHGADECVLAVRREDFTSSAGGAPNYSPNHVVEVRVYSFDFESEDPDMESMFESEVSFGTACFNAVFPQHKIWRQIGREAKQLDLALQQLLDMWVELPKSSPLNSPKTPQQNSMSLTASDGGAGTALLLSRQVAKVFVILEHFAYHLGDLMEKKRDLLQKNRGNNNNKSPRDEPIGAPDDEVDSEDPPERPETRKEARDTAAASQQNSINSNSSRLVWSESDIKLILLAGAQFVKCAATVNAAGDKLSNRTQNHLTCSLLPTSFLFREQDVSFSENRGDSWIRRACISISTIPYVSASAQHGGSGPGVSQGGRRESTALPSMMNPATIELVKQFHKTFMKDVLLTHGLKASMFYLGAVAFRMLLRDCVYPSDIDTSTPAWRNFVALRSLQPSEPSFLPMEPPASCPYDPSLRSMVVQLLLKDESNRPSPQQVMELCKPQKKPTTSNNSKPRPPTQPQQEQAKSPPKKLAPAPPPPLPLILSPRNAQQLAMTAYQQEQSHNRSTGAGGEGAEAILETPFETAKRSSLRKALETGAGVMDYPMLAEGLQMNSAHKQFYGEGTSHGRRPLTESSKPPLTSSTSKRSSPPTSRKSPRSQHGGTHTSSSTLKTAETAANDSRPSTPADRSPGRGAHDRKQPKYEPIALEFAL